MVLKSIFKKGPERRKFVRHPAEIPVEYEISGKVMAGKHYTRNISFGGLCFGIDSPTSIGTELTFRFTSINPDYRIRGKVAWQAKKGDMYEVGVEFVDKSDAKLAGIIEEIIYIKNFQKQIFENEN